MSFYGNISNTSRTHFQFDRVYANRWEMESNKRTDGIYAGRFVLVEYDSQLHMDSIQRVNKKIIDENTFHLYSMVDGDSSVETLLTKNNTKKNDLVYSSDLITNPEHGYFAKNCVFYKCTSDFVAGSSEPATFMEIVDGAAEDDYVINYQIDKNKYNRGYDSTVWQKVYINGEEHYFMVAELNTVIPVFALQPDAPTQSPIVPHFDMESSDLYYKLHYQPSWGMRVKSANIENGPKFDNDGNIIPDSNIAYTSKYPEIPLKSDETVIWERSEYDSKTGRTFTLYWYPEEKAWKETKPTEEEQVKGAIYYNKAGFLPEKISIDKSEDRIAIEPTGLSGHEYTKHGNTTNDFEAYPDIQEISMMLPSIGSSIAEMWNVVYGDENQNQSLNRNLDINWDSYKGLRMVKEKPDGNGFIYDPEQVNTLAGAINSVHDLMGMIIENPKVEMSTEFAKTADDNHIYYSNGKYYKKTTQYEYTEAKIDKYYEKVGLISEELFYTSQYWILENDEYILADTWNENQEYYKLIKKIYAKMGYEPIIWEKFDDFIAGKYFYGNTSTYTRETNNYPSPGREYIAPKNSEEEMFTKATFDVYDKEIYYKNSNNIALTYTDISGNEIVIKGTGYVNGDENFESGVEYFKIIVTPIFDSITKPYVPGLYYIYTKDGVSGVEIPVDANGGEVLRGISLCEEPQMNGNYIYYTIAIESDGSLNVKKQEVYSITDKHYCYVIDEPGKYIKCLDKDNNILLSYEMLYNSNIQICVIELDDTSRSTNFYIPGKYYTENDNKFRLYNALIPDETLDYYIVNNNLTTITLDPDIYQYGYLNPDGTRTPYEGKHFYLDYTYYYQLDNQQYTLDMSKFPTENRNYFLKKNFLYVMEDKNEQYGLGAEWNPNIYEIPDGVTLGERKEIPSMISLDGFARTLNTIHGLILKVSQMLLAGDAYTRDNRTVQGAINVLNDIIAKFEVIAPGQIMTVDEYGRVHSTPYTTKQEFIAHNYGNNEEVEFDESEDRWINMEIDTNVQQPQITIQHNFTKIEDTITTSTQNEDNTSGQIKLFTPIVDNTGHMVGHNIETVELPHNFKFITVNGDTVLEADNHIANFNINGDEWIQLTPTADNDTIKITHEYPKKGIDTTSSINLNDENNSSITLETNTIDAVGHIVNKNTQTVEMPYNFKSITINGNNDEKIIANNHVANFNVANGDRWIKLTLNADEDTFAIWHEAPGDTTESSYNTNDTPAFGATFNVPTIKNDNKGHITEITQHTVQIPLPSLINGTGNIVTQLSLEPNTGIFTETKANIGTLSIVGYTTTDLSSEELTDTDTLNGALGKLQLQINAEIVNRNNAVQAEISEREAEIIRLESLINDLTDRIAALENPTV